MSDLPPPGGQPPPPGYGDPYGGQPQPPPPQYPQYPQGEHQQYGYGYGYAPQRTYAGFWIRVGAVLLDGIIISIPVNLLTFSLAPGLAFIIRLAAAAVYYSLLEGGASGQTLGKKVCSIRVVDATTGQPGIGPGRACGRYFASWLSSIALGLGYLWMLWDPNKQTWHDKLSRTLVVKG